MKRKYIVPFTLLILLIGAWTYASQHQQSRYRVKALADEAIISEIMVNLLNNDHYSSKTVNDEVSEFTFNKYLENLDYNKQYFLQEDIDALEKYKYSIDDELKNGKLEFYFEAVELLYKRLDEVEELTPGLFDKAFDFTVSESFETDPDKRSYFKNKEERLKYWQQYAKYMVMSRLANKIDKQQKDEEKAEKRGEAFEAESEEDMESKSREQILENLETRYKRRKEIDDEDQFAVFINSLNAAFGPHTEYFPPQERENFEMRMTGRLEGIGAQLMKENEYIKVVSIVPGSASWRQGDLKENDLILKVGQADQEPVDIVDATMKDAISLIRGPKGTEVRLTVQKPTGEIKEISIIRDVVVQEETYAKSALITNSKTKHKIGYIYLPSFYSTFGAKEGRESAEDIRKEALRLKAENVSGIILDLRNNGGGSLQDAVDMAGHFFERGPVVQVKNENRPARVYGDRNAEVAYDGPLIIMVNNFSASASEILAAALKDYDRAVVVGSHTFGKGTVQTMLDLNQFVSENAIPTRPLGSVKITIQQFYRINGASTQLKGVHPHIYLPNEYGYMESSIKSYENPLPWDSISPAVYNKWTENHYNIAKLRKNSEKRVSKSAVFNEVVTRNAEYKKERDETQVSLKLEDELAERKKFEDNNKEFKNLFTPDETLSFVSLQEYMPEDGEDVIKEKKERWEKQLKEDFYLAEVLLIMEDMLH
ncbi:tail-specific protease [bacterium]|nr:tail-specific protease [bacterium]